MSHCPVADECDIEWRYLTIRQKEQIRRAISPKIAWKYRTTRAFKSGLPTEFLCPSRWLPCCPSVFLTGGRQGLPTIFDDRHSLRRTSQNGGIAQPVIGSGKARHVRLSSASARHREGGRNRQDRNHRHDDDHLEQGEPSIGGGRHSPHDPISASMPEPPDTPSAPSVKMSNSSCTPGWRY